MRQIKTYHIHTDFKFLSDIRHFTGGEFENVKIFVSDDSELSKSFASDILHFKSSDLDQVIRLCSSADLVVLYDLDLFKSKLALSLPKEVKIAWRPNFHHRNIPLFPRLSLSLRAQTVTLLFLPIT